MSEQREETDNSVVSIGTEQANRTRTMIKKLQSAVKFADINNPDEKEIVQYDAWTRIESFAKKQREMYKNALTARLGHIIDASGPGFCGLIETHPQYALNLQVKNGSSRLDKAKLGNNLRKKGWTAEEVESFIEASSTQSKAPKVLTVSYNVND